MDKSLSTPGSKDQIIICPNKFVKGYLRNYVNYLPDAEFMANNFVNESIGITPFFANKGYHPRTGLEPPRTYEGRGKAEIEKADKITERVKNMREWLQDQLVWAQEEYAKYAIEVDNLILNIK